MAIVIKGMEMPETCEKCKFNYLEWIAEPTCICLNSCTKQVVTGRMDNCPLVEIPDAIIESYAKLRESYPSDIGIAIIPTKGGVPLHEIQTREWQKGEDKE